MATPAPTTSGKLKKIRGAPREGQRVFLVVAADGQALLRDDGRLLAYSAKAIKSAATQAFRVRMRQPRTRAALAGLWEKRAKHVARDQDVILQQQRLRLTASLTALLRRITERFQRLTKGTVADANADSVLKMLARAMQSMDGVPDTVKAQVKREPAALLSSPKTIARMLDSLRVTFESAFEHPLGRDVADDRFFFHHFQTLRMAPKDQPQARTAFLCSMVRNTKPSALELFQGITYKSHLVQLPDLVAHTWLPERGRVATKEQTQAQRAIQAKKASVLQKRFGSSV